MGSCVPAQGGIVPAVVGSCGSSLQLLGNSQLSLLISLRGTSIETPAWLYLVGGLMSLTGLSPSPTAASSVVLEMPPFLFFVPQPWGDSYYLGYLSSTFAHSDFDTDVTNSLC